MGLGWEWHHDTILEYRQSIRVGLTLLWCGCISTVLT